jgi:hypothetical protein
MAEKPPQFTVTDRRKFTTEGDIREGYTAPEESSAAPAAVSQPIAETPAAAPVAGPRPVTPPAETVPPFGHEPGDDTLDPEGPAPTPTESAEQHTAYKQSSRDLDDMIRKSNPGMPENPEPDFEQLVQSIYLSAAMAMGAGTEPGQKPRIDIIGARQSIDLLGVLGEKTKGNLNEREKQFLQNALFDVRMMFLELTKAIAAQAKRPPAGSPLK